MNKKTLHDINVEGKRVFVRVDFNVPLDANQQITDDTRIQAALPTIQYLLDQGAAVVLASHLGRPKGGRDPRFSLEPVANHLQELLTSNMVFMAYDCVGEAVNDMKVEMKPGQVLVLENLRFHDAEKKGDHAFAAATGALDGCLRR